MQVYAGKNVRNMPKGCLIDILERKTNFHLRDITQSIEVVLAATEIQFLKEICTSQKMVILQMERLKFKEIREYAKNVKLE